MFFFSSVNPLFIFWVWEKVGGASDLSRGDFAPRPHLQTTLIDIDSNLLIFARYGHLSYINLHARNEENLPHGL